ncbi:MAG: hypothetical protein ACLP51_06345, partial [Syntrophobacteraceae bacterium]
LLIQIRRAGGSKKWVTRAIGTLISTRCPLPGRAELSVNQSIESASDHLPVKSVIVQGGNTDGNTLCEQVI